uniref:Nuclease HARBI1 n=2 Tax=Cacopsylla melanoneura TaxID=428564 RepID=A0A8D8RHN4_9HEMI
MGNGSQYHGIGAMHGIAKSSVCRQLHEVVAAICDDLFLREVCWPEPADRLRIAADFLRKGGFPSVGGCVDGTMVNIDSPSQHEEQYVNRHGNHALNVMAICGPNLQIYAASSRWPGSLHDSRVFRNTSVYRKFELENWRPFPCAVILGMYVFMYYIYRVLIREGVELNNISRTE